MRRYALSILTGLLKSTRVTSWLGNSGLMISALVPAIILRRWVLSVGIRVVPLDSVDNWTTAREAIPWVRVIPLSARVGPPSKEVIRVADADPNPIVIPKMRTQKFFKPFMGRLLCKKAVGKDRIEIKQRLHRSKSGTTALGSKRNDYFSIAGIIAEKWDFVNVRWRW